VAPDGDWALSFFGLVELGRGRFLSSITSQTTSLAVEHHEALPRSTLQKLRCRSSAKHCRPTAGAWYGNALHDAHELGEHASVHRVYGKEYRFAGREIAGIAVDISS